MIRARRFACAALATGLISLDAAAVQVEARVNGPHAVGTAVEFTASATGSGPITLTWDFGDGHTSESSADGTVTHTYDAPGHYSVIVVAKDGSGVRSDSFLQTIHRPLPARPPASSATIVHHRERGLVCNVNADNDTVSCLRTSTLELAFEAPVGRHPRTLAVAPDGSIWVANQDDATISVIDADGVLLDTIELGRAAAPFGIVMSPIGARAYVALQARGEIAELDVSTRKLLCTAPAGVLPTGVAVSSDGSRIFVTRFISPVDGGEVLELDPSLERVRTFTLANDPGPDSEASSRGVPNYLRSVVPSPDESFVWVPSKKDNVFRGLARDGEPLTFETSVRTIVSMLDLSTQAEELAYRVDLNNRTLGLALTFSPLGDYAFVALLGNDGIEVIDAYSRKVVGGKSGLGRAPDGLVLDDQGRLYLNAFLSRSVVVLDAAPILAATDFGFETIAEVVVSTAEKLSPDVLYGKQIFYGASDERMSQDGYISCAACHLDGFEDGRVWDFTDRGEGLRNTTSLLGRRGVGQGRLHWSANFDEVQDFEHDIRGPFGGKGFMSDEDFASGTRNTTLGDPKAGVSPELDALAAYVTSLDRVHPSPFRDPDGSLTEEGWRGREIFQRAGCPECHSGPDFTDSAQGVLHDVGTIQPTSGNRLGEPLEGIDTPTLRGIWETAPYLHDGSAETLWDVIGPRNPDDLHGVTSDLTDAERADLVSYLLQIDETALEDEVEPPPPASGVSPGGGSGCHISAGERSEPTSWIAVAWLALLAVLRRPRRTRIVESFGESANPSTTQGELSELG